MYLLYFKWAKLKEIFRIEFNFAFVLCLCNIILLDIKIEEKEKENITTTDKIKILWKIKYFQNIIILREAFSNAMVSIWYFHFCICLMRFFYMVKLWHIHGNIICVINESFMYSNFVLTIILIKTKLNSQIRRSCNNKKRIKLGPILRCERYKLTLKLSDHRENIYFTELL